MNKALMISIRPKHAYNIIVGKKTLELRTFIPKNYKGWVYVYVTNGVGKTKYHHLYNLTKYNNGKTLFSITHHNKHSLVPDDFLNSKVVFRFWFDEYDTLEYINMWGGSEYVGNNQSVSWNVDSNYLDNLYLDYQDVLEYGFREKPKRHQKTLFAWHIKQLEVFDKPKELSEFYKALRYDNGETVTPNICDAFSDSYESKRCLSEFRVKRAPQKCLWVYVRETEDEKL